MAATSQSDSETLTISASNGQGRVSPGTDTADVFDRVLVAVSETTDPAVVETATALAAAHGATLDALSVVPMTASVDHWDMVVERREDAATAALDTVGEIATERGVEVAKRLRYGTPAEEIERYADGNSIDLVVMGEQTHTGLRRFLSPRSVSVSVRRSASLPVVTVPSA